MKFKQVFCGVILAAIVLSVLLMFPVKASAASGDIGPNLRYTFSSSSGTLTISGTGEFYKMSVMSPPYNGYWSFNNKIRKVVIKEGATKIPAGLFSSCSNLQSVSLPESITSIDYNAFLGCSKLKTINIPKNLTFLGKNAFNGCALTQVHLPEGITEIKERTFAGCDKLQEVTIDGNLTRIHEGAFESCDLLTTVEFAGGSVNTIGTQAFGYCKSLQNFTFPEGLAYIDEFAFVQCVMLESLDLPQSLVSIDDSAFRECDGLTYVTIPQSVNYLGGDPFSFCENLQGVTVYSETVAAMKKRMLGGCDNIRYVHIIGDEPQTNVNLIFGSRKADQEFVVYYDPDAAGWENPTWNSYWADPWGVDLTVRTGTCGENANWKLEDGVLTISGTGPMKDYMQRGDIHQLTPWSRWNNSIQKLVIEEGVTSVGANAFSNMGSLAEVSMAKSVTEIYEYAFQNCDALTEARIGKELTMIRHNAYEGCNGITTVYLEHSPEYFGTDIFRNCLSLNQVHIGESVTEIPSGTFSNCIALKEVTIPANVKSLNGFSDNSGLETVYVHAERIEQLAFRGCKNLSQVYLMDTVKIIGDSAFSGCTSLENLIVPSSVAEISVRGMENLQTLRFLGDAIDFDSQAFSGITATVYYPADNPTWTEEVRQQYDGTITWVPYDGETPEEPESIPGDINGDGKLNNKDASCLFQHLSGWDVEVDEARLDINGDGKVNNKDASRLFQYLSGWDVEIR